jgi:HTH-like domain
LCELFSVSRSWYYERSSQLESDAQEIALRDQIERIILEFAGYGYRRMTHTLARQGWNVNHKRVLRQTARRVLALPLEEALCSHDDRFAAWLSGLSQSAGRDGIDRT